MKKTRFSVEQIVGVLKRAEVGVPVSELIRKVEISERTFYRWKKISVRATTFFRLLFCCVEVES